MRLYPPAWGIERRALADQEIGGYVIPVGAAVLMPTFVINRDPRLYPDPLRFDPERFLGEAAAARPDWAYPLFGGGTRKCIGVGFAMLEAVLVLADLGRRFRLVPDPARPVIPQARVSLRPRDGLWMRPQRRGA
jgi:cytochrome P450